MDAASYNFTCRQGDTFDPVLELRQGGETGSLVPLAGYTARMHIRQSYLGDIVAELSTANGRIVLDPDDGTIALKLSAVETAALVVAWACADNRPEVVNCLYDLELTDPAGRVKTILEGFFCLHRDVTR